VVLAVLARRRAVANALTATGSTPHLHAIVDGPANLVKVASLWNEKPTLHGNLLVDDRHI
jgi:hypothetical protein